MSLDGRTPRSTRARVAYVGQSLGSIDGTTFMAIAQTPNTYVQNAVLNVPGGGVVGLLLGSPTFSPIILGGLAEAGVLPGTPAFGQFVVAAQTVIDSGDPINFAFATANKNILAQEVVGGSPPVAGDISIVACGSNCYDANGNWLPDQVIPNTSAGFPLSGGNPLIAALGSRRHDHDAIGDRHPRCRALHQRHARIAARSVDLAADHGRNADRSGQLPCDRRNRGTGNQPGRDSHAVTDQGRTT